MNKRNIVTAFVAVATALCTAKLIYNEGKKKGEQSALEMMHRHLDDLNRRTEAVANAMVNGIDPTEYWDMEE